MRGMAHSRLRKMSTDPLFALIAHQARIRPQAIAVVHGEQRISYLALAAGSMKLSRSLADAGIRSGDRVGVAFHSSAMAIMALFALALLGTCAVPLSWGRPPQARAAIAKRFAVQCTLADQAGAEVEGIQSLVLQRISVGQQDLQQTQSLLAESRPEQYAGQHKMPWFIVLSSGSTGVPKGIALTQAQAWARIKQCMLEWTNDAKVLPYDLAIGAGLFPSLRALAVGGTVVVTSHQDFEAGFADFVNHHRGTHIMSSPWMAEQLLEQLERQDVVNGLPHVKYLWIAGGHCSHRVLEGLMKRATPNIWMIYASAETGILAGAPAKDILQTPGFSGYLGNWVKAKVLDEQMHELAGGDVGTMCFHAEGWPDRYAHSEDNQNSPFAKDWYRSSDQGRIDDQRRVFVHGRVDGYVNVAGMRIDPYRLEDLLAEQLNVKESAVFASLLNGAENRLTVAIRTADQGLISQIERTIHAHLQAPSHLVVAVITLDMLPRTPSGKIDRQALKRNFSVAI
jgi:acyl-coenzyme A synthetase/AMP-(fatty) acid ligase